MTKGNHPCLLGRDWLRVIKVDWKSIAWVDEEGESKIEKILDEFQEVFDGGMGTIKNFKAKLVVQNLDSIGHGQWHLH